MHFQGGGWCFTADDCEQRSRSWIGSSVSWPKELSQLNYVTVGGVLSDNATLNPDFATWAFAWVTYCQSLDCSVSFGDSSPSGCRASLLDLSKLGRRIHCIRGCRMIASR